MDSTRLRAFLQVILPEGDEWLGYDWRGDPFKRYLIDEEVDITLKEIEFLSNKLEFRLGSVGICHPDITIVHIPEEVKRDWYDPAEVDPGDEPT